jgi:hypothetical protein
MSLGPSHRGFKQWAGHELKFWSAVRTMGRGGMFLSPSDAAYLGAVIEFLEGAFAAQNLAPESLYVVTARDREALQILRKAALRDPWLLAAAKYCPSLSRETALQNVLALVAASDDPMDRERIEYLDGLPIEGENPLYCGRTRPVELRTASSVLYFYGQLIPWLFADLFEGIRTTSIQQIPVLLEALRRGLEAGTLEHLPERDFALIKGLFTALEVTVDQAPVLDYRRSFAA